MKQRESNRAKFAMDGALPLHNIMLGSARIYLHTLCSSKHVHIPQQSADFGKVSVPPTMVHHNPSATLSSCPQDRATPLKH